MTVSAFSAPAAPSGGDAGAFGSRRGYYAGHVSGGRLSETADDGSPAIAIALDAELSPIPLSAATFS
jgi:hypothetical protein